MGKASRHKRERTPSNHRVITFVPVTAPDWTPFEPAVAGASEDWLIAFMRDNAVTRAEAEGQLRTMLERDTIWLNSRYQVNVSEAPVQGEEWKVTHLSIKRIDKMPIHDWRDLQRIKNELCGPHREAVEIYPDEDRLVDEANSYHLWVFPEGARVPFGHMTRQVTDGQWKQPEPNRPSQRPFEPDQKPR